MSLVYVDGIPLETNRINELLPDLPMNQRIALDTETSGLFVDGDWDKQPSKCSPPARVSVVSLAWAEDCSCGNTGWEAGVSEPQPCSDCSGQAAYGPRIRTLALPFDQGRIGGKPGTWDPKADAFFVLPHTDECESLQCDMGQCQGPYGGFCCGKTGYGCGCAPWNLPISAWQELLTWLRGRPLVMHHKKFDTHIMRAGLREAYCGCNEWLHGGHRPDPCFGWGIDVSQDVVWDIMLAQTAFAPLESSSLKPTMKRLFGEVEGEEKEKVIKALRKNGKGLTHRYDLLPWDIIGPYAAKDAEQTLRLFRHQQQIIKEGHVTPDVVEIAEREMRLSKVLFDMEVRGLGFDAQGMRDEAVLLRSKKQELEAQLPFQPPNITAAKRYFFEELKLLPVKATPKGAPSLDAECISRYASDGVAGAQQWKDLANVDSALNKWYTSWPYKAGPDGRIRTSFRQGRMESDRKGANSGGAISGRLSAERVQAHGVPKEYRIPKGIKPVKAFFRAAEGHELWELDQSNAEVRVAAWASQCKALVDVFNQGLNVHDANTIKMFGLMPDDSGWGFYRDVAKQVLLAIQYGAGVRTLRAQIEKATGTDFSESKVKEFKDAIERAYPEIPRATRLAQRKADKSMGGCGYVRLVNGRRRVFGWGERTHKAFNAVCQGGVAEAMKDWMFATEAAYPGVLLNQVHDSIWVEVPSPTAKSIIDDIQHTGETLFSQLFSTEALPLKFKVDTKRIA